MISQVRYQVFVSSTYEDLREERQQATQSILEAGCFPSGMELFPASDESQWSLIRRVIEESDYYMVILGGRYGSTGPHGVSYTEMEYDYAAENGIPILGFVRDDVGSIPLQKSEQSDEGRLKLETFRRKVMSRTCRKYNTAAELGMAVLKSLSSEARIRPRTGWVRADFAKTDEDVQRERALADELKASEALIATLDRKIRDLTVLRDEIPLDLLSKDDDLFYITVSYTDSKKNRISEDVPVSWNEIFSTIAPSMYGFVCRKASNSYTERQKYIFHDDLEEFMRNKVVERAQGRKISILHSQVDTIVIQFKELGYIMFEDIIDESDGKFRGVTLTPLGERKITRLRTQLRKEHS